jgi:putative ABC transport system permease protein
VTNGATFSSLVGLAVDGLRRKFGRNILTMSGVFIGVLALTLIIALGQGMTYQIQSAVTGGSNLRQVGLSPGFGNRISEDTEITIEGEMSDGRRRRLRRSAMLRTRHGMSMGRRAQTFDMAALKEIADLPHVDDVIPIVMERYKLTLLDHETEATPTLGIDVTRRRLEDRLIVGRYLSAPDAPEALLHEYLAYKWGYVTEEQMSDLVGREIVVTTIRNERSPWLPSAEVMAGMLGSLDQSALTDEERASLPRIIEKISRSIGSRPAGEDAAPITRTLTVTGIVREFEASDPFNFIEDGNAYQVDLFLPLKTATAMFLESPVNREMGFRRALVTVDEAGHAKEVETTLRDRGHTAYSVASVTERIDRTLGILTLVVSFLTGIALVVAALGIVNTMVTSVLERTSEIGLWKAVGATNGQVRSVFVMEAAMIGLLGGLLGLGVALGLMVPGEALAARILSERTAIPFDGGLFRVPLWLALGGPALATTVAVLASLYPAARAARVDPVRALRHD